MNTEIDAIVNLPETDVGVVAEIENKEPIDDGITGENAGAIVDEARQSEKAEQDAKANEAAEAEKVKKQKPGKWERQIERERAEKAEMAIRLEKLEKMVSGKSEPVDAPPNIDDFDNVLDFIKAERDYDFKQFEKSLNAKNQKAQNDSIEQSEFQKISQAYDLREAKIKAENPDYLENLESLNDAGYITKPMIDAIYGSDIGEKITLHLTQNPDEAALISQLDGAQLYRVMGILEARLSMSQSQAVTGVRQTKAAPPIDPVKVQSASQKDPKDMSQEEFEEWRYKGRKK